MQLPSISTAAPTATAAAVNTTRQADPIEWLFYELRGTGSAHAGRYDQTTLELWADDSGDARLTDGRMTYPHDPGTVERWYQSQRWLVRDGIDPDAAVDDARRGVQELVATLSGDLATTLGRYAIDRGARPDRNPDQVDIWIRRASGARERYIVPVYEDGSPLARAITAAARLATTIRGAFDELDPALLR